MTESVVILSEAKDLRRRPHHKLIYSRNPRLKKCRGAARCAPCPQVLTNRRQSASHHPSTTTGVPIVRNTHRNTQTRQPDTHSSNPDNPHTDTLRTDMHTPVAHSTARHTRKHTAPEHTAPAEHTHPHSADRAAHNYRSHTATPAKTPARSASYP